ncbi:MAG: inorganic diphosphatase [Candidatus Woesebacteria bacterium]|nr:inorganic diphosphatase [Candidatus Woesebacteria bacterium]
MDFKAYIEIPMNSSVKYEVDEETGELKVDRFLFTAFSYPFNYGYVKNTKGKDGDPLDVIVLSSMSVVPGVVMKCHSIGLLEMEDEGGIDTKIIAVPDKKVDPVNGVWVSIKEVPQITLDKAKHFMDHMKELEPGKWVKTGEFKDSSFADKEIEESTLK